MTKPQSPLAQKVAQMKGELLLFKKSMPPDEKPNFSEIARQTGLDRHTVSKVWKSVHENREIPKTRKKRKSKYDEYDDEILDKLLLGNTKIKSVFKFMQRKYGTEIFNSYDSFKAHVKARKMMDKVHCDKKAHPRFETRLGVQVQFDWKEDLTMKLKNGETIEYNLFSAVFSASRFTVFIYTRSKTKEDLMRCLIQFMNMTGGVPEEFITDNMSALVSLTGGGKKMHPEFRQLARDAGTRIRALEARQCQRKGKVESANRFQNWLEPYQNELESEEELIHTVESINSQINAEISQTTQLPRYYLFKKEKEHLQPLPSSIVLESYLKDIDVQKVDQTLLVRYKGRGYSVPKKFMGKRVKLCPIDHELYIYYNANLIAVHELTDKPFNYQKGHYSEGLADHYGKGAANKDVAQEIAERARKNLEDLDHFASFLSREKENFINGK